MNGRVPMLTVGSLHRLHLVSLGLEMIGDEVGDIRLVVNDQNLLGLLFGHVFEDRLATLVG